MDNKVNLNDKDDFIQVLSSLLDASNGKLIIESDNVFVTSKVKLLLLSNTDLVEHNELSANSTESVFMQDRDNSATIINRTCNTGKDLTKNPLVTNEFTVMAITHTKGSTIVDYTVSKVDKESTVVSVSSDKVSDVELINALKTKNVIFIENLGDKHMKTIYSFKDSSSLVVLHEFEDKKIISGDTVVFRYSSERNNAARDVMWVTELLDDKCQIVCDMSWSDIVLTVAKGPALTDIKSVYLYANSKVNSDGLGTEELYTADDIKF